MLNTSAVPMERETLKSERDGTGLEDRRRQMTDAGRTDVKVEIFM